MTGPRSDRDDRGPMLAVRTYVVGLAVAVALLAATTVHARRAMQEANHRLSSASKQASVADSVRRTADDLHTRVEILTRRVERQERLAVAPTVGPVLRQLEHVLPDGVRVDSIELRAGAARVAAGLVDLELVVLAGEVGDRDAAERGIASRFPRARLTRLESRSSASGPWLPLAVVMRLDDRVLADGELP